MGVLWAYLGLTGAFGIIAFAVFNSAAVYLYSSKRNHYDNYYDNLYVYY